MVTLSSIDTNFLVRVGGDVETVDDEALDDECACGTQCVFTRKCDVTRSRKCTLCAFTVACSELRSAEKILSSCRVSGKAV